MRGHASPQHIHLPDDTISKPNRQEIERFSRTVQNYPLAETITGTPGTIANTGAFSTVTWTPATFPLYDQWGMVNPQDLTTIRIPMDGFYSIYTQWTIADTPAATTELEIRLEAAPTSDSGLAAPVFAQVGQRFSKTILSTVSIDRYLTCDWRGIEVHKDDLLRCRVRINGGTSFTTTTIPTAEFRYLNPIPGVR